MAYRRTTRSEQVRDASRTALLAAARTLLETRGYEQTTMQAIVERAGTSIGNAYFYFKNKESLVAELLLQWAHERWAESSKITERIPAGPERVGTVIYLNVSRVLDEHRALAKVLLDTEHRIAVVQDVSVDQWRPLLAEAFPALSSHERAHAAVAIFGANRAFVERVVAGKLTGPTSRIVCFHVRWALRGFGVKDAEITRIIRNAKRRAKALPRSS